MNDTIRLLATEFFRNEFGDRAADRIQQQSSRLHHPTAGLVLDETVAVIRRKEQP